MEADVILANEDVVIDDELVGVEDDDADELEEEDEDNVGDDVRDVCEEISAYAPAATINITTITTITSRVLEIASGLTRFNYGSR